MMKLFIVAISSVAERDIPFSINIKPYKKGGESE